MAGGMIGQAAYVTQSDWSLAAGCLDTSCSARECGSGEDTHPVTSAVLLGPGFRSLGEISEQVEGHEGEEIQGSWGEPIAADLPLLFYRCLCHP